MRKPIYAIVAFVTLFLMLENAMAQAPDITNYYQFGPTSGGKPKQIVLLLHGLGADGRDLMGLAPEFAEELPDAVFVSPDAPFPCDMAPMGFQWFSLQNWTAESKRTGVKNAAPSLKAFMEAQLKRFELPASKMALVGFSQGAMMSMYVAPRYPEPIAGVVAYSGALIGSVTKPIFLMPAVCSRVRAWAMCL